MGLWKKNKSYYGGRADNFGSSFLFFTKGI